MAPGWGIDNDFPPLPGQKPARKEVDPLYPGPIREALPQTPKSLKLPKGVEFLIDTREQAPYLLHPARRATLKTGDYTVTGLETEVVVERKSLNDILGCIAGERERFERELERLAEFRYPSLVVEAALHDILAGGFSHTAVHPNAVVGSLIAWSMRYGVHVWCARDRVEGQLITQWLLAKASQEQMKQQRDEEQGGRTP